MPDLPAMLGKFLRNELETAVWRIEQVRQLNDKRQAHLKTVLR